MSNSDNLPNNLNDFMATTTPEDQRMGLDRASELTLSIRIRNLTEVDLKETLADMCTRHVLLHHEISPWPIICTNPRMFLASKEVKVQVHAPSRNHFGH